MVTVSTTVTLKRTTTAVCLETTGIATACYQLSTAAVIGPSLYDCRETMLQVLDKALQSDNLLDCKRGGLMLKEGKRIILKRKTRVLGHDKQ
jgi:hypothetical protein